MIHNWIALISSLIDNKENVPGNIPRNIPWKVLLGIFLGFYEPEIVPKIMANTKLTRTIPVYNWKINFF